MTDPANPAFDDLMKMAGDLQAKMGDMKNRIAELEATGEAGAGMARVTLAGDGRVKKIHMDPNLFGAQTDEDRALAEDLIAAAFNDARARLEKVMADEMANATGDLGINPDMLGGMNPFKV
ncbi:MAG: YbaB/EbfC family nucleoid-associated protein [Alphaproteobacteria bacterium]